MSARLFADYAATPTPAERANARRASQRAQLALFAAEVADAIAAGCCHACGSTDHLVSRCPHAEAVALF